MVGFSVGEDGVNNHPASRHLVEDCVGVSRQLSSVKWRGKDWTEMRKSAEQAEDIVEIGRKEFAAPGAACVVKRVDRKRIAFSGQQQDYFCHAPSASFLFTSSHATIRLGSRK